MRSRPGRSSLPAANKHLAWSHGTLTRGMPHASASNVRMVGTPGKAWKYSLRSTRTVMRFAAKNFATVDSALAVWSQVVGIPHRAARHNPTMPCITFAVRARGSRRSQLRKVVAVLTLLMAFSAATSTDVRFRIPNIAGHEALSGFLYRPAAEGAAPAVVMLHGCSGLSHEGEPFALYRDWRDLLLQEGYVVLMVDSAASRGFKQTCTTGEQRRRMWAERPADAYAALAFLQKQPFVLPERVGLMGWSQGGGVVLLAIPVRSSGRPVPPPAHDFAGAIAFYPGACSERLQSRPFVDSPPDTWETKIPLLVLQGDADNWTPAKPCQAFIEAARGRGAPVTLQLYANAAHAFDAAHVPIHAIEAYREGNQAPIVGTNELARADARDRVRAFLKMRLRTSVKP